MKNKISKILILLGLTPFIGVMCFGFYSMFAGFSFLSKTKYGLKALIESIYLLSVLIWPLYVIGIILIIISKKINNQ